MRDVELYRHLLGLEAPWTVRSVELNVPGQRVDVWAGHAEDVRWPCPECGTPLGLYDHSEERVWRHLDSCQFLTYLHAQPPRVECPTHCVRQVRLPWAEVRARFTALFERLTIDVLKETDIRGAIRILRISWDEAWHPRAGRRARAARQGALRDAPPRRRREGDRQGAPIPDARLRPGPVDRRIHRGGPQAGQPRGLLHGAGGGPARRHRGDRHWTCGSPMCRPSALTCQTPRARSSSIANVPRHICDPMERPP